MLLVPLSTQVIADDPIEERQTAKEKYSLVGRYILLLIYQRILPKF